MSISEIFRVSYKETLKEKRSDSLSKLKDLKVKGEIATPFNTFILSKAKKNVKIFLIYL